MVSPAETAHTHTQHNTHTHTHTHTHTTQHTHAECRVSTHTWYIHEDQHFLLPYVYVITLIYVMHHWITYASFHVKLKIL